MPKGDAHRGLALPHLEAWRNYRVMTQAQLASAAGISRATIGAAAQGERVRHANIQKLATALGIDASTLVYTAPETEGALTHAG
jgi:transcriptional regulator with XRE-family HTH domain